MAHEGRVVVSTNGKQVQARSDKMLLRYKIYLVLISNRNLMHLSSLCTVRSYQIVYLTAVLSNFNPSIIYIRPTNDIVLNFSRPLFRAEDSRIGLQETWALLFCSLFGSLFGLLFAPYLVHHFLMLYTTFATHEYHIQAELIFLKWMLFNICKMDANICKMDII